MPQWESPGTTPEQLGATVGMDPAGIICSGGRLHSFREGWAKAMFGGNRAHYFVREGLSPVAVARCGYEYAAAGLFGAGNYPRCKRCEVRR